jgi:hypothetical protein
MKKKIVFVLKGQGAGLIENAIVKEIENNTKEDKFYIVEGLISQAGTSDPQTQTSGAVVKGVSYKITNDSNGDFTNVGAPNNDIDTWFIATSNGTPTSYGDAALFYDNGAPTAIILDNTLGNVWFTYQSGGIYYCESLGLFTEDKTICNMPQLTTSLAADEGGFEIKTQISVYDNSKIQFYCSNLSGVINSVLYKTPFKIKVRK